MVGVKGQQKGNRKNKPTIFKDKDGYLLLVIRDKKGDRIYKLHRLLLEYKLRRKLKINEVCHHINNIKMDNRVKNLKVKSKSKHQS